MGEVRSGIVLWPYHRRGDVGAILAAAHIQAAAAVAGDEWVGDVVLGTARPAPGTDGTISWPFTYQVAKHEPGSFIVARPR